MIELILRLAMKSLASVPSSWSSCLVFSNGHSFSYSWLVKSASGEKQLCSSLLLGSTAHLILAGRSLL